ncbi:MAG: hypothetical protein CMP10_04070 [Zetaproteobacteria bacterium]|nr:hypothetical protein [Pseudobdellovibrionaceae bacterium]|tara:strand:- start:841 stop:1266 length:426 start_codon:yes stop_codon:yes gene_type:complete
MLRKLAKPMLGLIFSVPIILWVWLSDTEKAVVTGSCLEYVGRDPGEQIIYRCEQYLNVPAEVLAELTNRCHSVSGATSIFSCPNSQENLDTCITRSGLSPGWHSTIFYGKLVPTSEAYAHCRGPITAAGMRTWVPASTTLQ